MQGMVITFPEPDYLKIIELLHVPLQTIYGNRSRFKENGLVGNNV